MGGNSELIDEVISPAVAKQVADFEASLVSLDAQMVKNLQTANKLIGVTGGSKGFGDLNKNAAASQKELEKLNELQAKTAIQEEKLQQIKAKGAADELTRTTKQSQLLQAANDKVIAAEAKKQAAILKSSDANDKATKKQIDSAIKAADAEEKAAQRELASMVKLAQKRENDARAYNELVKNRDLARGRARDVGATFGEDSELFKSASKEANDFDEKIKGINKKLGDFTPNVGNYASAAFGFIRQAAYILPGIGIAGIFNLLFEGLAKIYDTIQGGESTVETAYNLTRKANDAYAEQATTVSSLVAELKDQNTESTRRQEILEKLNSVSPTYFGGLKDENDIVTKLPDAYKKYNEALLLNSRIQAGQGLYTEKFKEILKLQQDLIEANDPNNPNRYGVLADFYQGINGLSEPAKLAQIKQLQASMKYLQQDIIGNQKGLQDLGGDIGGDKGNRDQRLSNNFIEVGKIQLQTSIDVQNKIAENEKKSYNAREIALKNSASLQVQLSQYSTTQQLNDISLTKDKREVIEQQGAAAIIKIRADLVEKQRSLAEKAAGQDIENLTKSIEIQKSKAKKIIDDPEQSYQARLDAVGDFYNASSRLIEAKEKQQVKLAGDNEKSITAAKKEGLKERLDRDNESLADTQKIQTEANNKLKALFQQGIKNQDDALAEEVINFKDAQDSKLLAIDVLRSDYLKSIADTYTAGEMSTAEYSQAVYDIEADTAKKRIDVQIATAQKIIDVRKKELEFGIGNAKTLEKAQDELTRLQIQSSDLATKVEIDNLNKLSEARKKIYDLEKQLTTASIDLIKQLVDGGFANQLDALKGLSDQVDKNAQQEKDVTANSLLSTQQKADKDKLIDAQAAAQKDAIAVKERDIKHKQAEFDKAISIAKIVEATAVAEIEALSYLSNPLTAPLYPFIAGLIGALGAVQLATVIATPIPKFKYGTDSSPAGLAIVGDGGGPELIQTPNGKTFLSPAVDTLINLPGGSKITSYDKLLNLMSKPEKMQYVGGELVDMEEVRREIRDGADKTVKALKGQKQPIMNGWLNEVKASSDWGRYASNHFR